uniref:Endosome-associated-trafficking regulator 1 n=1 Tax=Gouania willdenowi TaxID=441366 RepID=A0A8C5E934_GOUWI
MSEHRRRTLIITDDEETNPFSFREFLRSKEEEPDDEEEEEAVAQFLSQQEEGEEPSYRKHIQQLEEENSALKRSNQELHSRVQQLCEDLQQSKVKEQKEAADLETMFQSVEHNLLLTTKRAVKAESCVSKLKAEIQQLQEENNTLKSQCEVVMTMREKAQTASEYLNRTTSSAHSALKTLLAEADSLRLVSDILRSIDRLSSLHSDSA